MLWWYNSHVEHSDKITHYDKKLNKIHFPFDRVYVHIFRDRLGTNPRQLTMIILNILRKWIAIRHRTGHARVPFALPWLSRPVAFPPHDFPYFPWFWSRPKTGSGRERKKGAVTCRPIVFVSIPLFRITHFPTA